MYRIFHELFAWEDDEPEEVREELMRLNNKVRASEGHAVETCMDCGYLDPL